MSLAQKLLKPSFQGLLILLFALSTHVWGHALWVAEIPPTSHVWEGLRSIYFYPLDPFLVFLNLIGLALIWADDALFEQVYEQGRFLLWRGGLAAWLAILVWGFFSIFWAREAFLPRYQALHLLLELGAALSLAHVVWRGWEVPILWGGVAWAGFQAILSSLQLIHGASLGLTIIGEPQPDPANPYGYGPQGWRGYGLELHPNILAGLLVFALFLALLLIFVYRQPLAWAAVGLITLGLFSSLSRTSLVILPLMLGLLFLSLPRQARQWQAQKIGPFILGALGLLIVLSLFLGGPAWRDLSSRTQIFIDHPDLFAERLVFAHENSLAVWQKEPLLGLGLGQIMVEVAYHDPENENLPLPVHNAFLVALAELGLVGGLAYLFLALQSLRSFYRQKDVALLISSAGLVALFLLMIFDFYLWPYPRLRLFWLLAFGLWWGYQLRHYMLPPSLPDEAGVIDQIPIGQTARLHGQTEGPL
jgi:hypothetical protein